MGWGSRLPLRALQPGLSLCVGRGWVRRMEGQLWRSASTLHAHQRPGLRARGHSALQPRCRNGRDAPWNPWKRRLPSAGGGPALVAQEARVSGRLPPESLLEQSTLRHRPDRPQRQLQARTCLRAGQDLVVVPLTLPGLRPPLRQAGVLGPSGDQVTLCPLPPPAAPDWLHEQERQSDPGWFPGLCHCPCQILVRM